MPARFEMDYLPAIDIAFETRAGISRWWFDIDQPACNGGRILRQFVLNLRPLDVCRRADRARMNKG